MRAVIRAATAVEDGTVHLNDTEANIQVWGEPVIDYPLVVESGTELLVVQNDRNYAYATLEIGQDGKLTNNGTVTVDEGSTLILLEGLDQTDGSGTLECTGTVKLPPEEKLIALSGAEDLTYNGTEQSPEVSVTLKSVGLFPYLWESGGLYRNLHRCHKRRRDRQGRCYLHWCRRPAGGQRLQDLYHSTRRLYH